MAGGGSPRWRSRLPREWSSGPAPPTATRSSPTSSGTRSGRPTSRPSPIDERDAEGRPVQVTFRAAAFGRSTSYTLRYDYSDAPTRLSWEQVRGDVTRRLDGSYDIYPSDDGSADITYHLVVDLKVPLPVFVKRRAEGRITYTALKELKARVEI